MNIKHVIAATILSLPFAAFAQQHAAEVLLVTGSVKATAKDGAQRSLSGGDAVDAGDSLVVGPNSYANLKFSDGGRILLRPNTEFAVEAWRYKEGAAPAPEPPPVTTRKKGKTAPASPPSAGNQAFFRLVRGGFRAISGLIKGDRGAYHVSTPVATIGIRGTDYEVQTCTNDCPSDSAHASSGAIEVASNDLSGLQLAAADTGGGNKGGVIVATNEGTVVLQTGKGEFLVKIGEVAFAIEGGQVFKLPEVPEVLLKNGDGDPKACD
ncbi:MAG TPA: FecR family protein [Candidatus Binatia bacterium]|nr:FecR family protein [Candidatus Binatia bacterium]